MTQDTKLIAGVAAVVIIGAAGIAFLASSSAERDAVRGASRLDSPPQVAEVVTPVSYGVGTASETATSPMPVEDVDTFEVEKGVDYVTRGLEFWNGREFGKAAAYFEAAAVERPETAWTHYMLALSLWKSGDPDGAVQAMEKSAALDGSSVKTFVNLSRIQNDRGEFEAALEAARAALAIDGGDAGALFLEGRSLRNLGRRSDALVSLKRSVELDPENGYTFNLLGLTLLEMDRETEAVGHLETAAQMVSDAPYIHNNLGMAYERCGDLIAAMTSYHTAATLDGEGGKGAVNLARLDPRGIFDPSVYIAENEVSGEGAGVEVVAGVHEPDNQPEASSTGTDVVVAEVDESGI